MVVVLCVIHGSRASRWPGERPVVPYTRLHVNHNYPKQDIYDTDSSCCRLGMRKELALSRPIGGYWLAVLLRDVNRRCFTRKRAFVGPTNFPESQLYPRVHNIPSLAGFERPAVWRRGISSRVAHFLVDQVTTCTSCLLRCDLARTCFPQSPPVPLWKHKFCPCVLRLTSSSYIGSPSTRCRPFALLSYLPIATRSHPRTYCYSKLQSTISIRSSIV